MSLTTPLQMGAPGDQRKLEAKVTDPLGQIEKADPRIGIAPDDSGGAVGAAVADHQQFPVREGCCRTKPIAYSWILLRLKVCRMTVTVGVVAARGSLWVPSSMFVAADCTPHRCFAQR